MSSNGNRKDEYHLNKYFLNSYRVQLQKKDYIEERLKGVELRLLKMNGSNLSTERVQQGTNQYLIEDLIIQKEGLKAGLANQIIESQRIRENLLSVIDSIENAKSCIIIEKFYIDNKSLSEISEDLYMSISTVRRYYTILVE